MCLYRRFAACTVQPRAVELMACRRVVCIYSGALTASSVEYSSLTSVSLPESCVSIQCQGYENSLAECVIYDKDSIGSGMVAAVTCYKKTSEPTGWCGRTRLGTAGPCWMSECCDRDLSFRAVRLPVCKQQVCDSEPDLRRRGRLRGPQRRDVLQQ